MDPLTSLAVEPARLVDLGGPWAIAFAAAAVAVVVGVALGVLWECRTLVGRAARRSREALEGTLGLDAGSALTPARARARRRHG